MRNYITIVEGLRDWIKPVDADAQAQLAMKDFRIAEMSRRLDLAHDSATGVERLWWIAEHDRLAQEVATAYRISVVQLLTTKSLY